MKLRSLLVWGIVALSNTLFAQSNHPAANAGNAEVYQIHIKPASGPVEIDGQIAEPAWQILPAAQNFWQQQPIDDKPASQQTEVRLCYDERFLYIAATCYDKQPYFINTLKRDNYEGSDEFAVFLDPNGQKANGYAFGVNAMNAQTEALMSAPDNGDPSWDNRWASAVTRSEDHWTVEIAIPFKTLRFKEGSAQWGIQFTRTDPGANEVHTWAPVPRQFSFADLGYYGALVWEQAPRRHGHNIELIPYATAAVRKAYSPEQAATLKPNFGGDMKIALTSSLNLDLTTNPDFSQVEVDRQVTNLTRFGIFFPERRQFFIENGDIFTSFGTEFGAEQPFYSRRIGLDPYGQTVPILYGVRLTGNINPKFRIGVFNMHAQEKESKAGQNYSAATLQHRMGKRSFVKGLFLSRQAYNGSDIQRKNYGRNAGAEYEYNTTDGKWQARFGGLHAFQDGVTSQNNHVYGRIAYSGQRLRSTLEIQNMGSQYASDMGFTGRLEQYDPVAGEVVKVGFTQFSNMTDYYTYPKNSKNVNFHWSGLENFAWLNPDGTLNEWYTRLRHFIFFKNTSQLRFRLNNNYIHLLYPFDITEVPLPATAYNMTEFNIQYNSDTRKKAVLNLFAVYGQFFNGNKLTTRTDVSFRAQPWGNFSVGLERNDIWLPEPYGNLALTLANARVEINFASNVFWTTFLQYNTQANNFNINSRLQWRFAPMSDVYLVYTDNYRVEGIFGPKDKTLVLKLNYWLSL